MQDGVVGQWQAGKIRALPRSGPPVEAVGRFITSGIALNVIRQTQDSLDSAASGAARYVAFSDLLEIDYPLRRRIDSNIGPLYSGAAKLSVHINRILERGA